MTGQIDPNAQISALYISGTGIIYALNQTNGVIYRHSGNVGGVWNRLTTSGRVKDDFVFFSENEIYSFGTSNRVFRWDGRQWIQKTKDTGNQSLYVSSAREIYAINPNKQTIVKWDSGTGNWITVTSGRIHRNFAFVSENRIYSIGLSGDVFEWIGSSRSWSRIAALAGKSAKALQMSDSTLWVLSGNGKIYREEQTGKFAISSDPPGSTVFLNGENKGAAGGISNPLVIENMTPGVYQIQLRRDGCPPSVASTHPVTGGQTTTLNIGYCQNQQTGSTGDDHTSPGTSMPPSAITWHIESNPLGANVFLNNIFKGIAPLALQGLERGVRYEVRCEKEGYVSYTLYTTFDAGSRADHHSTCSPSPTPKAVYNIVSNPAGARVFLNGADKGETPLHLELAPTTTYTLKFTKEGYHDSTRSLKTSIPGQYSFSTTLSPIVYGMVRLMTRPQARVFLDGVDLGQSQPEWEDDEVNRDESGAMVLPTSILWLTNVSDGTHPLRVTAPGFEDHEETITPSFTADPVVEKEVTLALKQQGWVEPPYGPHTVNITSIPEGAEVRADGEALGRTPLSHTFPSISPMFKIEFLFSDGTTEKRIYKRFYPVSEGNTFRWDAGALCVRLDSLSETECDQ
ncbi:MAG: PEGA domain-containing protein [Deltaproteobacteria bacterium]|nr:PEGA domain-containing protein [Deltaproteobacteria bacterium]